MVRIKEYILHKGRNKYIASYKQNFCIDHTREVPPFKCRRSDKQLAELPGPSRHISVAATSVSLTRTTNITINGEGSVATKHPG